MHQFQYLFRSTRTMVARLVIKFFYTLIVIQIIVESSVLRSKFEVEVIIHLYLVRTLNLGKW